MYENSQPPSHPPQPLPVQVTPPPQSLLTLAIDCIGYVVYAIYSLAGKSQRPGCKRVHQLVQSGKQGEPYPWRQFMEGGGGGVPFCSEINTNCVGSIIDLLSKGPDDNAIGKLFNIRVSLGTRTYSDQFGYIC